MIDGGEIISRRGRHRQRPDLPDWRTFLSSDETADLAKSERSERLAHKVLARARRTKRLVHDRCQKRRMAWAMRELQSVDGEADA